MTETDTLVDTSNYSSTEDFVEEVIESLDDEGSVLVHGPENEKYGDLAYLRAKKEVAYRNFRSRISLNPKNWVSPDLYTISKQELDDSTRISYQKFW
jgi:hypothetical protein